MAEEEGEAADRDLRRFLTLVIGKMILGTRGDPVGCRFLPLLEDLSSVGFLSTATGVGILPPPLPAPRGGEAMRRCASLVALAVLPRRAIPAATSDPDPRHLGHHPVWTFLACGVQVWWTPYVGEDDATQLWVERGRPYFGRDIWLHCFNTVVPLHHWLVARTLGLHQAAVEFPTRQRAWERLGRSFRGIHQVVSKATSDEDYFRAYAWKYGAQVYKGSRRPLDPEGRISSLEGILHSTIQQRDDLQAVVDQLRTELDRAQQMVGGASSSREDPGRSVLEGQLASAAARVEDTLAQLRER
ncbi:hypothetical protein Taro_056437, partial [Colocasia esculenta]|nr:hypothetical protein [Colocasia esculenta]